MMKQLLVRNGGSSEKVKPDEVLSAISKAKNKGTEPGDLEDDYFANLAVAYQNELRAQNAVDFDDLLLPAEKILREHADVRDHFEYIPWIERACKSDSERQQRGEGIHSVIDSLRAAVVKGKSLQAFLDESALASDREDDDLEQPPFPRHPVRPTPVSDRIQPCIRPTCGGHGG